MSDPGNDSLSCLVTGAAGFIGSHLCERLVALGHSVVGVDRFTNYYARDQKERNLASLRSQPTFRLVEADLASAAIDPLVRRMDVVFHLAGQPGVRESWGDSFDQYLRENVRVTQRLLEALRREPGARLLFASSSSIYGDAETLPTNEDALPRPVSPYGVTKLAAEHLCYLYWKGYGIPAVSVRYFTVYGPRQRPDMAFHRFLRAILEDREIIVYGDGEQTRDFTYVSDAVSGTIGAALRGTAGSTYNLGGGSRVTVNEVLVMLQEIVGKRAQVTYRPSLQGDARHTSASIDRAAYDFGYQPIVELRRGLLDQLRWIRSGAKIVH